MLIAPDRSSTAPSRTIDSLHGRDHQKQCRHHRQEDQHRQVALRLAMAAGESPLARRASASI